METSLQQNLDFFPQPGRINPPYCFKRVKLNPPSDIDDANKLLKKSVFEKLLLEKKLLLVLDLNHTLLHSVILSALKPEDRELFLKKVYDPDMKDCFRVKITEEAEFITKLRPGLVNFLEEASKMVELYVFTKGSRDYAVQVLKLIDPENNYFGCNLSSFSRVFTRESCVGQKNLELVMGKESGILIVDDQKRVWRDVHKKNMIEIPMYNFFGVGSSGRKLPGGLVEAGRDESETKGRLSVYLGLLKVIHAQFFDTQGKGDVLDRDVRVLKSKLFDYSRIN